MKLTKKLEIEALLGIFITALICISIVWNTSSNSQRTQLTVPINAEGLTTQAAFPTIPKLNIDTTYQPSPDGTKKLIMTTTHNEDGTLTSEFKTTDSDGGNAQFLYTVTVPASEGMSIPFNTWSPDDKYVFIQKNNGDALVFSATGEDISEGQKYIGIKDIFNGTERADYYHETTGWASPTLLIVNTVRADNKKGSSYWFEIPSKAIIQLSSQF